MYLKLDLHTVVSLPSLGIIPASNFISKLCFPLFVRYESGFGSCLGLSTLNGSKASKVTIQGDIDDAKFLPKNGPNGTYSHF